MSDVSRYFSTALDVGCGRGHIAKATSSELIGSLYQCDMADQSLVSACDFLDCSNSYI